MNPSLWKNATLREDPGCARFGPAAPSDAGLRLGPGGGIRIGLASVVNLTAGYGHNLRGATEREVVTFPVADVQGLFH